MPARMVSSEAIRGGRLVAGGLALMALALAAGPAVPASAADSLTESSEGHAPAYMLVNRRHAPNLTVIVSSI